MKALLICPVERSGVEALARSTPLAGLPALGRPLVIHWLEHLIARGAKEVRILAADRPEQIRALVRDGSRWGLQIEVLPELRELTPAEARAKYCKGDASSWLPQPDDVSLMDYLPCLPENPLFESYAGWFAGVQAYLQRFAAANHLGAKEVKPGVWVGLRARVAPSADLRAPCWIGSNSAIGAHAVIGPNAVIEDRAVVESHAEISNTVIGPETFIGELLELQDSLASGSTLVSWKTSSSVMVPDAFLMCSLSKRHRRRASGHWLGRLAALFVMVLTFPLVLIPFLKAKILRRPSLHSFIAVRPRLADNLEVTENLAYYEMAECKSWLRFWPQMWNIVRGDFAWVGNRPLSPVEVAELSNDFERLWLAAPIGLISLAQAEGITSLLSDEARACASFYAVQANWRLDISILARTLLFQNRRSLAA